MAFSGYIPGNLRTERLVKLRVAKGLWPFASTTGAIDIGMRGPFVMKANNYTVVEVGGRKKKLMVNVNISGQCKQTNLANVQNMYILGEYAQGATSGAGTFCNVQAENAAGEFLNFIENSGAYGSENGCRCLGLHWKLTINSKERILDLAFTAQMSPKEFEWLVNATQMASGVAGPTNASAGGLTSNAFDWTKELVPGFIGNATTIGGSVIGASRDTELILESHSFQKDDYERDYNTGIAITVKTMMQQMSPADLTAVTAAEDTLPAVVLTSRAGETFTFNAGCLSVNGDPEWGDEKMGNALELNGVIVNNPDDASPTSIDFSVANALTCSMLA